ncbi:hypothetical protein N9838_00740 [Acidimicrobiia bacterium]|nr:hypothetical protein [Acidimicrobiia bacterium]
MINFLLYSRVLKGLLYAAIIFITFMPLSFHTMIANQQTDSNFLNQFETSEWNNSLNQKNCLQEKQIDSYFIDIDEYLVNEVSYDIYVIPEFENLKCIGSVVQVDIYDNELTLYIGTNEKVTSLIFYASIIFFTLLILAEKNRKISIAIFISSIFFTSTFLIYFLPVNPAVVNLSIAFFIFSFVYYLKFKNYEIDISEISLLIIFPTFALLHFNERWLSKYGYIYFILVLVFYFKKYFLNLEETTDFVSNLFLFSFALNFGSFFTPLRDAEHWRQNQNAFASKMIGENGVNFLNPLPLFGTNSLVPMEFPILQNLSGLLQILNVPEPWTLRPIAWIIFLLLICSCYITINKYLDTLSAKVVTTLFIFNPYLYKFSNAYMIDFLPHLFGILALYFLDTKNRIYSSVLISLSVLAKLTTGIIYIYLFLIILIFKNKERIKNIILPILIIIIPNIAWNIYADYIKAQNPLSAWLTSSNLRYWNFGTYEQYLDPLVYRKVAGLILDYIWGKEFIILGILVFVMTVWVRKEAFIIFLIPFIFLNLHQAHEYYFISVVPLLILLVSISLKSVIKNEGIFIFISFLILLNINIGLNQYINEDFRIANKVNFEIEKKDVLSEKLSNYKSENIYLSGNDWVPIIFYESNKKGFMYQERFEKLGNSKWDSVNIEREGIELFVFKEGNLNLDHLDTYLKFMFDKYSTIKVDYFLYQPDSGACMGCRIFYLIFSEYEEGDFSEIIIHKDKSLLNYYPNNCSSLYGEISERMQNDLSEIINKFNYYSYEIQNKNYTC